jgi:hypothetical protein
MMNELEKSDPPIVAAKPANKSGRLDAESVEPRGGAEGNTVEPHTHRTQSRASVSPGLERVRERGMIALPSNTQGGSPVRESRPPVFVQGALSNECPYRDRLGR